MPRLDTEDREYIEEAKAWMRQGELRYRDCLRGRKLAQITAKESLELAAAEEGQAKIIQRRHRRGLALHNSWRKKKGLKLLKEPKWLSKT